MKLKYYYLSTKISRGTTLYYEGECLNETAAKRKARENFNKRINREKGERVGKIVVNLEEEVK